MPAQVTLKTMRTFLDDLEENSTKHKLEKSENEEGRTNCNAIKNYRLVKNCI